MKQNCEKRKKMEKNREKALTTAAGYDIIVKPPRETEKNLDKASRK